MKVAIVHEWLDTYAGSERVLEQLIAELAKRWGDAFTMKRFFEEVNAAGMIPVTLVARQLTGADAPRSSR